MAGSYSLRSQDQDDMSYAALPGTAQTDFVPHNMTPLKSNLAPGREVAGCHPSRWIYELINNNFTVCDMFERLRGSSLDNTYAWDHPHKLVINGNQSFLMPSTRVLSAVCLECHFHFVFKMAWDGTHTDALCDPGQSAWPLRDNQFPWHHLVWVGSAAHTEIRSDHRKYYPLLAREHFVCSAPPCTFQVVLEVSEPRMPAWWLNLLLDRAAICDQLRLAREQEPSRYEGATDDWAYQAPLNLNTYLKNLLESGPDDVRSISKRNKRFAVLFGPRCFSIFQQLEFAEQVIDRNGVDEGVFTPTAPVPSGGPSGTTELGTYRAYLEDVRAETQCLIHKAGQAGEPPTYCTPVLHTGLQCQEVSDAAANALVNTERYRILGVLPNQPREIVVNAYKRQWELLPSRRRALVESLMGVANDTGDQLLSDYAITQSSVFDSQLQRQGTGDDDGIVSQALSFLGLQPPNNYGADSIIQAFRQKLVRDPASAVTARSMLMLIARASTDDLYQTTLLMESDAKMSLETARAVLGLASSDMPWELSFAGAKSKVENSKSEEETSVYLDALDALADHKSSATLKQAALELRQSSGILDTANDSRGATDAKTVNFALPVGLNNIGNTCYLNSLLQYLFTVKPIRDIVLNYDDSRLDLTDESIKARLLGGNRMQMDRGEAVVAQAFAQELATLFQNLQSSEQAATRPSQRLANAVLLSTHTLLHSSKQASDTPAASQPPPLPARPSPALPNRRSDDDDMDTCNVSAVPEAMDTASNSSSRTLVDQEDVRSDHSYEKVETPVIEQDLGDADSAVEIRQSEDVSMSNDAEAPQSLANSEVAQINGDITMSEDVEPETVDQKVLNALEHQKRSSGTDQQDVEEVMGSIINRLQAAIRPSSIDAETGIQLEKIMETFFVTTVNYTKKFDDKSYQHEISFDRSITAFPAPDGPCSLYDALGRNFDQQILEESKLSRYTAIKTLPPVLHVLIQRSQSMGSKNGNAVVIPETLYLDRYMDAPHDSPTFRHRVEDWAITDRIADLRSLLAKIDSNPSYLNMFIDSTTRGAKRTSSGSSSSSNSTGINENRIQATVNAVGTGDDSPQSYQSPNTDAMGEPIWRSKVFKETWDFDGPVEDGFLLVKPATSPPASPLPPASPPPPATFGQSQKPMDGASTDVWMRETLEKELQELEKTREEQFEGMKSVPYRLQAVICHRGHLMSGHYWVWIRDFEDQVWRWYNDADVCENKDTAEVLNILSRSGEPYFLCYVRDNDKEKYVNVPKRRPPATMSEEQEKPPSPPIPTDNDGDVNVGCTEHPASQETDAGGQMAPPGYRVE